MAPQLYANDLKAKSWKVANRHQESTLTDVFIKIFDAFVTRALCNYWTATSQAAVTDIASQVQSIIIHPKELGNGSREKLPEHRPT